MRRRRILLVGACPAVVVLAGAAFGGQRAAVADPARQGVPERLAAESLDVRLSRLEHRLGLRERVDPREAAFRLSYDRLRARERAVAVRAELALRFVPAGAPVPGGVVTSAFSPGRYHPILHRVQPHVGLDIAAPMGTPVHATADGTVYATANNPTYGLTVDIRHGDSDFVTRYAHLSRISVVAGKVVRRGDEIGRVGSTGLSTGPHTHYEVFYWGWRRDPIRFMAPGPVEPWRSGAE